MTTKFGRNRDQGRDLHRMWFSPVGKTCLGGVFFFFWGGKCADNIILPVPPPPSPLSPGVWVLLLSVLPVVFLVLIIQFTVMIMQFPENINLLKGFSLKHFTIWIRWLPIFQFSIIKHAPITIWPELNLNFIGRAMALWGKNRLKTAIKQIVNRKCTFITYLQGINNCH